MRRYKRRALFPGAIYFRGNEHAVPMDKLRRVRVIDDLDRNPLARPHPQHRSGCTAVVADRRQNVRAVEFDGDRRNAKRVVSTDLLSLAGQRPERGGVSTDRQPSDASLRQSDAAEFEETAPIHRNAALGELDLSRSSHARSGPDKQRGSWPNCNQPNGFIV